VTFDGPQLEKVLAAVCDRLEGDFLLIGGALVALWLEPRRTTEDVDLIGVEDGAGARSALLSLAHDLGLPVEALNSAADFFVHRIPGWREQLEPFRSGVKGRVLRPSPTLFVRLKLARLSEQDLQDCLAALARVEADGLALDRPELVAALRVLPSTADARLAARRAALGAALER
jgi:hypothetical protein